MGLQGLGATLCGCLAVCVSIGARAQTFWSIRHPAARCGLGGCDRLFDPQSRKLGTCRHRNGGCLIIGPGCSVGQRSPKTRATRRSGRNEPRGFASRCCLGGRRPRFRGGVRVVQPRQCAGAAWLAGEAPADAGGSSPSRRVSVHTTRWCSGVHAVGGWTGDRAMDHNRRAPNFQSVRPDWSAGVLPPGRPCRVSHHWLRTWQLAPTRPPARTGEDRERAMALSRTRARLRGGSA
jgi:hypothetical protein